METSIKRNIRKKKKNMENSIPYSREDLMATAFTVTR